MSAKVQPRKKKLKPTQQPNLPKNKRTLTSMLDDLKGEGRNLPIKLKNGTFVAARKIPSGTALLEGDQLIASILPHNFQGATLEAFRETKENLLDFFTVVSISGMTTWKKVVDNYVSWTKRIPELGSASLAKDAFQDSPWIKRLAVKFGIESEGEVAAMLCLYRSFLGTRAVPIRDQIFGAADKPVGLALYPRVSRIRRDPSALEPCNAAVVFDKKLNAHVFATTVIEAGDEIIVCHDATAVRVGIHADLKIQEESCVNVFDRLRLRMLMVTQKFETHVDSLVNSLVAKTNANSEKKTVQTDEQKLAELSDSVRDVSTLFMKEMSALVPESAMPLPMFARMQTLTAALHSDNAFVKLWHDKDRGLWSLYEKLSNMLFSKQPNILRDLVQASEATKAL